MAELHVQPKRNNYWWLWLLLAIIIIGGAIYYYVNYYQKGKTITGTTSDSTYSTNNTMTDTTSDTTTVAMGHANLWSQVDFNSPDTTYSEVTDKNIKTRSNAHFVIYTLNSQDLFVNDKSDLSNNGKQSLKQVGASINKRFDSSDVKIYDQADTTKQDRLATERAEMVRNYLINNSKLDQQHVTVYQRGEPASVPDKSNTVNIVVKR
jgi:flagellar motor protein MotB